MATPKEKERKFIKHRLPEHSSTWRDGGYYSAANKLIDVYNTLGFSPIENIPQFRQLVDDPESFVESQILQQAKASGGNKVGNLIMPDSELLRIFKPTVDLSPLYGPIETLKNMSLHNRAIWDFLFVKEGKVYFDQAKEDNLRSQAALYLESDADFALYDDLVQLRRLLDKLTPIFGDGAAHSAFYKKYLYREYNEHFNVDEAFALLK